jgi:hypothetical protein
MCPSKKTRGISDFQAKNTAKMSEEISKEVLDVIDRIMCNDPNMTFANFGGKCIHVHDSAAAC